MKPKFYWAAASIAAIVVLLMMLIIANVWESIGDSDISSAGWLAMGLGVVVTLVLGVGLMTLVFISNRRGYDEVGGSDRERF